MGSLFLELSKQQKLLEAMEERGFTLCQQNGQRTYGGPPPNWGSRPPPSRDSEVFIGRIPRMCFEDELIPLFLSVGELYEFRLMLDFSGTNRGYGYAHYATLEGAMNAIKVLNRYEIRPGHFIGVLKSKNNCRLLFGNITPGVTYESFHEFITSVTGQVLNVFMFSNFEELRTTDMSISMEVEEAFLEKMPRSNAKCQFAIVEYENHKAAAVARRVLIPKYGHVLAIDWAVPPRERKHSTQGENPSSHPNRSILALTQTGKNNENSASPPMKIRAVPALLTRPSFFDNIYMPKEYTSTAKYFRFLINVTLYRSAQRGVIPPKMYLEIERKILDRISNLENCCDAVQLIFSYLSWYKSKTSNMLDLESQRILQEVKAYSETLVHFIFQRVTCGKSGNPELENYYCDVLPLQLNFIFHMVLILPGEEKTKLCGRISTSLQWYQEVMQRVKSGDVKMRDLLVQMSRMEQEMGKMNSNKDNLSDSRYSFLITKGLNDVKTGLTPSPAQNCMSQNLFNQQMNALRNNFARSCSLSSSSASSYQADEARTDGPIDSDAKIVGLKAVTFQGEDFPVKQDGFDDLATGNHLKEHGTMHLKGPTIENENGRLGGPRLADHVPDVPFLYEFRPNGTDRLGEEKARRFRPLPILIPHSSVTDYVHFMPKCFYNVVKYFKYLIRMGLQKGVQNNEIPLHIYKEVQVQIIDHIANLENCVQGIKIITDYFFPENDTDSDFMQNDLGRIIQDVRLYSNSFINFIHRRDSIIHQNPDLDDYYCRVLPYQLSFLYRLTLILRGEEREKLSGRVTDALHWLNELISKNKSGDVEVIEFFERISRIGAERDHPNGDNIMSLVKEAYMEYNMILGPCPAPQNPSN